MGNVKILTQQKIDALIADMKNPLYPNDPRDMTQLPHEVSQAIIRLNDVLCSWERATGKESVLILRARGFEHRSISGKPGISPDITDEQLYNILEE